MLGVPDVLLLQVTALSVQYHIMYKTNGPVKPLLWDTVTQAIPEFRAHRLWSQQKSARMTFLSTTFSGGKTPIRRTENLVHVETNASVTLASGISVEGIRLLKNILLFPRESLEYSLHCSTFAEILFRSWSHASITSDRRKREFVNSWIW